MKIIRRLKRAVMTRTNEENQETEKSSDDQDNVSEHKVNQEEKGEV